jgi:Tol biopolymer transport system component
MRPRPLGIALCAALAVAPTVPGTAAGPAAAAAVAPAQRKQGSPLAALPPEIELLTRFGERADFSPDGRRVAFMAKSFGDAFVIDLDTRAIRCLTCNVPGAAFLRVMHLASGDYLLIGPDHFEDVRVSRSRDNELWFLGRSPGSRPVKLGQRMSEGAAVSKTSLTIGFALGHAQDASLPEGTTELRLADVDTAGVQPRLTNRRAVQRSASDACTLEAQDFFDADRRMTFTCYEPAGKASVWTLDLASGATANQSAAIGFYNEVEGIFPDGRHACVESDHQARVYGDAASFRNIDIWKLLLDGTGRGFTRLTRFNDYEGWKASNPVVSSDGRFMAFQAAHTGDEAGVGYGLLLMRLDKPEPRPAGDRH